MLQTHWAKRRATLFALAFQMDHLGKLRAARLCTEAAIGLANAEQLQAKAAICGLAGTFLTCASVLFAMLAISACIAGS